MPAMSTFSKTLFAICFTVAITTVGMTAVVATATTLDPGKLESVFGEGKALVKNGDYVSARKNAEKNALRNGLSSTIRMLISEEEIAERRDFLEEHIFSRGLDFVESYRFINEGNGLDEETDSEIYSVSIEYSIFFSYLSNELSNLGVKISGGNMKKVIVLIDEETLGMVDIADFLVLPSTSEESISKAIAEQSFMVIDRTKVRELGKNTRVVRAVRGDTSAIRWLAEQYEPDYIILGKAKSQTHQSQMGNPAYVEGIVTARIYSGKTLSVIWRKTVLAKIEGRGGGANFKSIRLASDKFQKIVVGFMREQM